MEHSQRLLFEVIVTLYSSIDMWGIEQSCRYHFRQRQCALFPWMSWIKHVFLTLVLVIGGCLFLSRWCFNGGQKHSRTKSNTSRAPKCLIVIITVNMTILTRDHSSRVAIRLNRHNSWRGLHIETAIIHILRLWGFIWRADGQTPMAPGRETMNCGRDVSN